MPEVVQLVEEKPEKTQDEAKKGSSASAPPRTTWSGNLRIGLVNIPVKALLMTKDVRISFRMLHRSCKTAISFKRFCQEGEEVTLADIVYGYPLGKEQVCGTGKEGDRSCQARIEEHHSPGSFCELL